MQEEDSSTGVWVIGGGLVLALVLGAGFMLFVSAPSSGTISDGPGSVEIWYTITGGAIETDETGLRQATVHVAVAPDSSLKRFDITGDALKIGASQSPVRRLTDPPGLPTEKGFDLIFELPKASEEDPAAPRMLRMKINSKTTTGFLGSSQAQSSRSVALWVRAESLELWVI
jgi:hypothetical protein